MLLVRSEGGVRDAQESRGVGEVYKRQGGVVVVGGAVVVGGVAVARGVGVGVGGGVVGGVVEGVWV